MPDDLEELRRLLRDEGIGDGSLLRDATRDSRLADAADQALAGVLTRSRAHHRRRRLTGALAAAAVAALALGAAAIALQWHQPTSTPAEDLTVSELSFAPGSAPAGALLDDLAKTAASQSAYGGSGPQSRSWYEWDASSPQRGRLVAVTRHGQRLQVETFTMPPPDPAGRVDLAIDGQAESVTTVRTPVATDAGVLEALNAAAGTDCTLGEAGCALVGLATLRSSVTPEAIVGDAAAWRALATLPEVQAVGRTTDRLGRLATGFAALNGQGDPGVIVLADPDTGGFMGAEWSRGVGPPSVTRIVVVSNDPGTPGESPSS